MRIKFKKIFSESDSRKPKMSNLPAGVTGNDLEMFGSSQEAAEEFLGIQNEGEFPIISSNFLVLAGALV